jgi:hypothetical protein
VASPAARQSLPLSPRTPRREPGRRASRARLSKEWRWEITPRLCNGSGHVRNSSMPLFNSETARAAAAKSHQIRAMSSTRTQIEQASEIAEILHRVALRLCMAIATEPLTAANYQALTASLAAVTRAWDILCNRLRILRGKPLPASRRSATSPDGSFRRRRPKNLPPWSGPVTYGQDTPTGSRLTCATG